MVKFKISISTFIFIYWCVCVLGIVQTGVDIYSHIIIDEPLITVRDVTIYREVYLDKPHFSDRDVAELVNQKQISVMPPPKVGWLLCSFAFFGLCLLVKVTFTN